MSDLLTMARENDLPPMWDGLVVEWGEWRPNPPTTWRLHSRGAMDTTCEGCGSLVHDRHGYGHPQASGFVAHSPRTTREDLAYDAENRRRLGPLAHKRPHLTIRRLIVSRCPECRLDTVWDNETDEWWVLDHTDYGPTGSERPQAIGDQS